MQKAYVERLISIVKPAPAPAAAAIPGGGGRGGASGLSAAQSDVLSVVKGQLRQLQDKVKSASNGQSDSLSKYHLLDLSDRIEAALDSKK